MAKNIIQHRARKQLTHLHLLQKAREGLPGYVCGPCRVSHACTAKTALQSSHLAAVSCITVISMFAFHSVMRGE